MNINCGVVHVAEGVWLVVGHKPATLTPIPIIVPPTSTWLVLARFACANQMK